MRTTFPKEQLAQAVAGARSWRQVNTRLGRAPDASSTNLKVLAENFGIDVAHLTWQNRRSYTDDQLRDAVTRANTWKEVATLLNKNPRSGAARAVMRRVAARIGLDVSKLEQARPRNTPSTKGGAGEGSEEAAGVEPAVVLPTPR